MLDDVTKDVTALGGLPIFLIVTIVLFIFKYETLAKQLFAALIVCYSLTAVIRFFYFKSRPKQEVYRNIIEKIDASSFPSLHSMRATILAVLLSAEFSNMALIILFSVSAFSVYLTRILLRRHYFIDVVCGAVFGVVISFILIYFI